MRVTKSILLFSFLIATLAIALQYLEYQYWVRSLSTEVYVGVIASLFLVLGWWLGNKWTSRQTEMGDPANGFTLDADLAQKIGLSKRETEVLQLISEGHSNQEIADELYVSLSTIKTHVSNVFSKLDVQRRTQAMKKVQELGLLQNEPKSTL
jgi:DNA-binding NarL/FixJ family response regulator